ncbi:unnamed protein product [Vitrella brassicaformis CCMP3155]|uniref:Uncharacterized protein n=1 Tax=Vitrella brassicaformis (strain CCMP3155) TaxID=1169540 RepID=A0A0G4F385_VITBC|nr:unnamed protein product [Vitrella brassicaformis CCMP3155]|mmetsp:Transcript_47437/g.118509  ORF Transcript_47437/g.118509 Transcript_47437/m.118509 type:complete len:114 (-) Transcript_47437:474-815(-)|eukprot:CEM06379.1 unnamed protein product [Vitrella brassicaformis CCMP3155]
MAGSEERKKLDTEWQQLRAREAELKERIKSHADKEHRIKQLDAELEDKAASLANLKAEIKNQQKQLSKNAAERNGEAPQRIQQLEKEIETIAKKHEEDLTAARADQSAIQSRD